MLKTVVMNAVLTSVCLLSMSCLPPLALRADYKPVGLSSQQTGAPTVRGPQDVLLFRQNGPRGFTLRENELSVEPGYGHRILGAIEVRYDRGACSNVENYQSPAIELERLVRARAFAAGANAVIYYQSDLTTTSPAVELRQLCISRTTRQTQRELSYAYGWAVVISDSPKAPAAPAVSASATSRPPPPPPPPPPADARLCAPGVTQLCVGVGACKGAQVCRDDGKAWGSCDCGKSK